MTFKPTKWTKTDLQIYILLLCANADKDESKEELKLIQSKVTKESFEKIYKKFQRDSKKKRLKKIERNIHQHNFSTLELRAFRDEIFEVFFIDGKFKMMEQRLSLFLDNIVY